MKGVGPISTEKTPDARLARLYELAHPCRLCPRRCGVDRPAGERGRCSIGALPLVASSGPHYGEESVLVGRGGSGTIFLAGCNLRCEFCQNWDISHQCRGTPAGPEAIAAMMLRLEGQGCHNVNLVTPTHVAPWLAEAIVLARGRGLAVPVVHNGSGYESVEALALLDGLVEIYMPDAKFWRSESSERYCDAPDYPERVREALKEMQRQVGDLEVDERGLARRGLLIRHLVMPGGLEESRAILGWIASEVSPRAAVNVMGQYYPCYHACEHPEINRRLTAEELAAACDEARRLELRRV
jgi:putative pyruvate formate lyase activating enzyme